MRYPTPAGGVKILAVSSAERSPFLPDVPTLKESGIDLVADGWYGMWLPAGSSPAFARQLSTASRHRSPDQKCAKSCWRSASFRLGARRKV